MVRLGGVGDLEGEQARGSVPNNGGRGGFYGGIGVLYQSVWSTKSPSYTKAGIENGHNNWEN